MIFCDKDGVLADFDKKVFEIFGDDPKNLKTSKMWKELSKPERDFYYNLDPMPDAFVLWDYIKDYEPTVLTGLPRGNWAPDQKRRWVRDNLGSYIPVITCQGSRKHEYASPGDILIDDRPQKAKDKWESVGGIFITHVSAENTINELKRLGY